ncbi:hypothetical protein [Streptomyces sp. NPDC102476]
MSSAVFRMQLPALAAQLISAYPQQSDVPAEPVSSRQKQATASS